MHNDELLLEGQQPEVEVMPWYKMKSVVGSIGILGAAGLSGLGQMIAHQWNPMQTTFIMLLGLVVNSGIIYGVYRVAKGG